MPVTGLADHVIGQDLRAIYVDLVSLVDGGYPINDCVLDARVSVMRARYVQHDVKQIPAAS
jgi:hypothetical protein